MNSRSLAKKLLTILTIVVIIGTIGYIYMGYDPWKAFYTTVIIMLSHFKHGVQDSRVEQLLDIGLILSSYFILAYMIKGVADYVFSGALQKVRRKKKMSKKISEMRGHYIVCGFGRVGKQVAEELKDEGVDFVVIDRDSEAQKEAQSKGFIMVEGDPITEESLLAAGIKRAKSLVAALGRDTDNLFLTLTAKSLSPDLYVVARASNEDNVSKLEKAGADRVTLPYQIGGYHMAAAALRPAVVDFLDIVVDGKHTELQVEEIRALRGSRLVGSKITEIFSRKKNGITVLAINRRDGSSKINPSGEEIINRDDQLIVMGTKENLERALAEYR